ncbi:MAG: carboxy-S-adenosyl-L-methionine synthase CmoA [Acidobacteriota bacterium]|nr:carboxy-S-adenosyl-L-methionine synthase CmoA [Acidobacteriota bacterium]
MKDRIFREPLSKLAGFEFDEKVAAVFDDMAHRSIPFYEEVQTMIVDLVGQYYQEGTRIYDLGCSTGSMTARLALAYDGIHEIVGIDSSSAMIDKARANLDRLETAVKLTLEPGDVREVEITDASVVIMNYTLQFVRPLYRERVIERIFNGLQPGGVLILSEKVLEENTHLSRLFIDAYYRFKRARGYTELEISQKRERLENVLVPYKVSELTELLQRGGFSEAGVFFKWHNFASLIAMKSL